MAFLHCHTKGCGWSQDDFWDHSYNPCRILLHWEKDLLSKDRDKQFTDDAEFVRKHGPISTREVIAQEFEAKAKRIRKMLVPTFEEWRALKEKPPCPKCGQTNWDID